MINEEDDGDLPYEKWLQATTKQSWLIWSNENSTINLPRTTISSHINGNPTVSEALVPSMSLTTMHVFGKDNMTDYGDGEADVDH